MKKFIAFSLVAIIACPTLWAQKSIPHSVRTCNRATALRREIHLPKVKGFNCYKGDFHIHTSYSDGRVNPAGRVVEAWLDGLDIIAITDHYESRSGERRFFKVIAPYYGDDEPMKYKSASEAGAVLADFNAIHEEAAAQLKKAGYPMLLIKGCEMARGAQTHGHFNALFLKDINTVYDKDMAAAFRNVKEQGGIVVHNHPAWRRDTSDKTEFHELVYGEGLIDGVEVANGYTFYPHIVRRCVDEKLAMFGNSDEHDITTNRFGQMGVYRTMTLVFAKNLTEKAIKDAILARRTVAYSGGCLIGEESWLVELLNEAVDCRLTKVDDKTNEHFYLLTNTCSIPMHLRRGRTNYLLEPFKSVMIGVGKGKTEAKDYKPVFTVDNMWVVDYKHPKVELKIDK